MPLTYRREIDGLRAIAVSAVVLYHAGIGRAGYVGVDVFFVISGYLITALLLREHAETGGINLLAFYARRVRRIFPAAAVLVLATIGLSSLLLPPEAQAHALKSAAAALVFVSNLFFQFYSGGYFDGRSEEMPLLHLWSLSVEEQFYLLWPALLIVLLRYRPGWLRPALIALAAASLLLTEVLLRAHPDAAFYQTPARFWELAAGGLIATLPARPLSRAFIPAGIVLTLAACALPIAHFPGVGALPAVVGAGAIIAGVHGGAGNALLRSRPMVAIGLLSYSLYLWHWPLLALYRATSIGDGSQAVKLQLCALALLLAAASYRYVEQPFRRARWPAGRTVAIGFGLSAALALGACAWGLQVESKITTESDFPSRRCHSTEMEPPVLKCSAGRVAIWGDSMAYAWSPWVWQQQEAATFTRDACAPLLGYLPDSPLPRDRSCVEFNARAASAVAGMDRVYLVARWQPEMVAALAPTLDRIAPTVQGVVIIGPTPEMRDEVGRCIRQHDLHACAIPRTEFDAFAKPILAQLRQLAATHPNVEVLDPTSYFCSATECGPTKDGRPLYWDSHHIATSAARDFPAPDK